MSVPSRWEYRDGTAVQIMTRVGFATPKPLGMGDMANVAKRSAADRDGSLGSRPGRIWRIVTRVVVTHSSHSDDDVGAVADVEVLCR